MDVTHPFPLRFKCQATLSDYSLEKIFLSSLKSYAKYNCLLDQVYIHDTGKSVAQAVKDAEGKVGAPIKIAGYIRYALGEGIEKATEDFAEEVKKAGGA